MGLLTVRTTTDHVYEYLREMLWSGSFKLGERLNENQIAAQLGVSRSPLREACHRLANEGLVVFERRRGAFVRDFSLRDIAEIYETRAALASWIIRHQKEIPPRVIKELEKYVLQMKGFASEGNIRGYRQADRAFDDTLRSLCENSRIANFLSVLESQVRLICAAITSEGSPTLLNLGDEAETHFEIWRALKEGRLLDAALTMEAHILAVKNALLRRLEQGSTALSSAKATSG